MKKFYALTLIGLEKIKTNNLNKLFDFLRKADKLYKIGRMRPALQLAGVGKLPLAIIFSLFSLFAYSQNDEVTSVAIPATQTGAIIYGASASATYTVTLTSDGGAADGLADLSLNWSGPVPTGATYSFSPATTVTIPASSTSTAVTLTITSANGTSAGTYNFTVSSSNNPVIGTDPQTSGTSSFIVTQAPLTITSGDQSKTYGATLALGTSAFTSTGLQNSETIGSVTLTSTGTPNTAAAGTYPIVPSAATGGTFDPANYAITYANGTLTVNQALLSITANSVPSKNYGVNLIFSGTAFTSTGLQNSESIGSVTLTSAGTPGNASVAGSPYNIIPSAATGGSFNPANYAITYINGTLTVKAVPLTITATAQSKVYGTTAALGTTAFTFTGIKNGETVGSVTLTSTGTVNTAAVGNYPITPSAATGGTFNSNNYTITYNITTPGQLTVTQASTTTSVTSNNNPSCIGTSVALTATITSVLSNATGQIGFFDGATSLGTATISGTTASINISTLTAGSHTITAQYLGDANYTGSTSLGITQNVTPSNTAGAPSSSPTLCISTTITPNITIATIGATGIGAATGLPAGVTAAFASNTITISGTPTASGTFSYSIPLTGGCGVVNAAGTIIVTANNTVTAGSTKTLCISTAITPNITHTTTGATGIGAATGLPAGVTAAFASNTITISGTPTASGTFNYSIPLTGGCGVVSATGTIVVTPNNTVGAPSSSPTLCISTAIAPNITIATTGATGIGAATGLPAGVTAAFASNTITISGTPTASGTFNYSIPLTGGCGVVSATGTIIVTANNTVTAGSTKTLCINTAIAPNITHTTTGATAIGAATGLPAGVTASFASNTITISGTPTASGTFNYSIPLTGGCGVVSATGTIIVTANNTVTPGSTKTLCINTAITPNITHTTTGATGIGTPTGLPAGVTASFASNTITISGTPSASGTFNYSIPLTGGCGVVTATGTINVTANNTAGAPSSSPTLCINTALSPNITITTTGATGIGAPTGLPAGVTASFASNTITISGTPTASGTFNYSIPLTGGCGVVTATGTIIVTPNNTITLTSAAGTNNQGICIGSAITNITYSTTGATGATFSGLPANVTGNWASNIVTISGTPPASGTFSYTITTTGGCITPAVTATGTITINTPPSLTGYAICQSVSVPSGQGLTSTASCVSSTPATSTKLPTVTGNISNGSTWANTGNISAIDGVYSTTAAMTGGNDSKYLYGITYGFSIPANATINGVTVTINRLESAGNVQDESVALIIGGTVTGTDHATGTTLPTSAAVVNYGSATDTWGLALTPAQVNAANFGVAYAVINNGGGSRTASVDYIQVTVAYTIPGTLNWYTAISGGTLIGNGTPFNPETAAGSGVTSGSPPGTYPFYAECTSIQPGCRSEADFVINPSPAITGITTICAGSTTQLIGSPTANATNPWTSSAPSVATVNSTGLVTGIAGGTSTITYTNSNGCQTTTLITVRPAPTATIATSATQVCQNGASPTITFTNPQVNPITVTFTINGVTQPTINIAANGTNTTTQSTATASTYVYNIASVVYQSAPTCNATTTGQTVTVVVRPTPTAAISGTTTVCQNGAAPTITFTNPQALPITVTYNINGSGTPTINVPANGTATVTAPTGTAGNYNYNITSVSYQTGPTCPNSISGQTATVVVNPTPTPTISGTTTVCQGGTAPNITFTNTQSLPITITYNINGSGSTTINVPGSGTATVAAPTGTAGVFAYNLTGVVYQSGPACNTTITGQTATVTVRPTPLATISGTTSVCFNGTAPTVTFTNPQALPITITYNINGSGTTTINVSANGTATAAAPTGTSGTFNYNITSVSYQTAPNCPNPITGQIATVTVNPLPVVSITGPNPICAGFTTTLSPSTGGTWISNNTSVATVNASTGVVTGVATTTGTATFTYTQTSTGCVNTTGSLTVNALPVVAPITDGATNICVNSITQFTDATSGGTWSVTNGTGTATIDNTGTVLGTSPGNVTVVYTYFNGACTNTASVPLTIDVQPAISPVGGGATAVCENAQTPAFTDATAGGTWSIINGTGSATVTPSGGVVTGVSAGTVTVLYTTSNGSCTNEAAVSLTVVAAPPVAAITGGVPSVCITSTTPAFMDATPAGIWGIVNGTGSATISTGGVVTPTTAGTVTVTYTITNGTCNNTASKALTIDLIPTVAAIGGGSTGVCVNGTTPAFTDMTTGGTWSVNPGTGTASITSGGIVTGLTPGTVTVMYTVSNTTCSNTATQLLTVNALPVAGAITGASSVCAGSTIALNSNATGTGTLTYTWTSTITTAATVTNAGVVSGIAAGSSAITYTVSDGNGCVSTSISKTITVNARPAANVTSVNTSVCNGGSTNITGTVTASGAWTLTLSNSNTATGTGNGTFSIAVTPAANTTYTISSLTDASCTSIASDLTGSTIVTVNNPPNITSQPADVTACNTTGASIFVGATGTGLTYQWYKGISPGGTIVNNSVNITGATTNILHFNQAGVSDIGDYYAIITGTSPCGSVTSNSAHLDVSGTITISSQPAPQTVCAGTDVTFSVTATTTSGNSLTYQWTKNGINISGATASTYTITGAAVADAGNYAVSITDISTCPTAFSSIAVLTVNPIPTATISGTTTICQGGTSPNITFTNPQALPITVTYNINGTGTTTANVAANATMTVAALTGTAGTFNYNLVSVAYQAAPTCTNAISGQTATVTVRATPTASISGTISVCKGSTAPNITFTNPLPLALTVTYNINGVGNININIPANGTNTVAAPTGTPGTFAYNLVSAIYQTAPSCMGTLSGSATVTVIYPVMTSINAIQICNHATVSIPLTSTVPSTYTWIAADNIRTTGESTTTQTTSTLSNTLNNNSPVGANTPRQDVIYTVIPTSTALPGCQGQTQIVTVTVNPSYNVSFYEYPDDTNTFTICDGDEVGGGNQNDIDLIEGQYSGATLLWQYSIGSPGPWNSMVGPHLNNQIHDTLPDPPSIFSPQGSYYFRLLVNGCTSDTLTETKTSTLTINAGGPNNTVCEAASQGPIALSGATVGGTASTTVGGTWTITSLSPSNGGNIGTLSNTGFLNASGPSGIIPTINYTPPANYTGVITLTLTSNDPDGPTQNIFGFLFNTCVGITATRTITISPAPIISNPLAMSICSGSGTNINLTSAIPSNYAWTLGPITGSITGASAGSGNVINQVLTNPSTTASGTVTYNVTPTPNPAYPGCAAVTSSIVVTVNPSPAVSLTSSTSLCQGSSATLTATNSGGILTGTLNGSNYTPQQIQSVGPSTITSVITLPALPTGSFNAADITLNMNITHTYVGDLTVKLTSPCGTTTIFDQVPNGNGTNGRSLIGNYTFTTSGGNTFPVNGSGVISQVPYTATFAGIAFPCGSAAGNWTLTVTDHNSLDGGYLNNWTLSVNTHGVYTSVFGPGTITPVTYSGANNITATAVVTPPVGTNNYTATTTDPYGCSKTTTPFAVVVNPTLTLSGSTTTPVCTGSPATINLTGLVANSTAVITYKIGTGTNQTVTVTATGTTGSFNTANLTSANNGQTLLISNIAYNTTPTCPQTVNVSVSLVVNPAPTITGGTQAPGGVCPNSSAQINLTGLVAGTTSTTTYTINGGAPQTATTTVASGTGTASFNTIPLVTGNTTLQITGIAITSATPSCTLTGLTINVPLTVNPIPSLTSTLTPPAVCSGNTFGYTPASSVTGTTYAWARAAVAGISQPASSGTGGISEPLTNTTSSSINVTYVYTLTANGCSNAPGQSVVVSVSPSPTMSSVSLSQTGSACEGSGGTFVLMGLTPNYTAILYYTINNGPLLSVTVTSDGTGKAIFTSANLALSNNGQIIKITGVSGTSCIKSVTIVSLISVNPSPTLTGASQAGVVCAGGPATVNLTGMVANSTNNTITYTINGAAQPSVTGVNADASGNASFNTTILTAVNNGQSLVITSITNAASTCSKTFTVSFTLSVNASSQWLGVNTDWFDIQNWCGGIPTITSNIIIPVVGTSFYPIINTGNGFVNNITIQSGASVTVTGGMLTIHNSITNGGTFDVTNGTVEFNGTSLQTIGGGTFSTNTLRGLVISNTAGVTLSGPLNITDSLTYGVANGILNSNGNLTLKSSIIRTAWLGNMTNHTINGDVTVERYIATGPTGGANHGKSWQLLATSTKGQTINQSWMEGASATNVSSPLPGTPGNPVMNYGTMMTSDRPTAVTSDGFDAFTTPGPSIKVYNAGTGLYDGPVNTSVPVYNQKGYFVFVRGDRSVYTSAAAAVPTILRTKGTLFTTDPAHLPPSTSIGVTSFESIGNPYAAPLDMRKITKTPGVEDFIQVWDPRIGGTYNYGVFVTFLFDGTDYRVAVNGSGSYPASGNIYNYIQSGQAFFMQTSPGMSGTVSFSEAAKAGNSFSGTLFTREANGGNGRIVSDPTQSLLRMTLNSINADGSAHEALDGVLEQFGNNFSNDVDSHDARKAFNTGENLSIKTAGKLLVIERRHTIIDNDTIFLNLTGERAQPYQFSFDAQNLSTVANGFVEDAYTKTRTPLNLSGNTIVNFKVENIAGSYAPDRFRIVFSPLKVLPVTFTSIKAYKKAKDIDVEWRVDNERNIKQYEIEKSINGTDFSTLTVTKPSGNNGSSAVYVIDDTKPIDGYNYYRVRSVDISGVVSYSTIVKVAIGVIKGNIEIHPNPITDGQIHLQFMNEPAGKYGIRLLNKLGQVISQKQITREDGSSIELIKWDFNLAHGIYNLEVTKPDGSIKDINVLY